MYGKKKPKKKTKIKERRKQIERFAKENRHNLTEAERKFSKILKWLNIDFEMQCVFSCRGKLFIVDFYLPQYKIVIEIDGGYHNTPQQQKSDSQREQQLKKHEKIFGIIRFQNEEIRNTADITWRLITGICPPVARLFDKHEMQVSADPGAFVTDQYRDFGRGGKTGAGLINHNKPSSKVVAFLAAR